MICELSGSISLMILGKKTAFKKLLVSNCPGIPMGSCLPLQVFKDEKSRNPNHAKRGRQVGRISTFRLSPAWQVKRLFTWTKSPGLQWQHFRYRHRCLTCFLAKVYKQISKNIVYSLATHAFASLYCLVQNKGFFNGFQLKKHSTVVRHSHVCSSPRNIMPGGKVTE